jgi:hypothetical protein
MFRVMQTANLAHVSTGEPTYWPSDRRNVPDLIDFVVVEKKARAEPDGTRAETTFRLSPKRTSPFKSAGKSVQSTAGSRGLRISYRNAGYTTFRGRVRILATHAIRQFTLHFPSRASPCATTFRTQYTTDTRTQPQGGVKFRPHFGPFSSSHNLSLETCSQTYCANSQHKTNWATFRTLVHETLTLHVPFKTA